MKKFFSVFMIAVCCMALAMPAQAQLIKFGVKGGVNLSKLKLEGMKDNSTGFFFGPMAEITIPVIGLGVDGALLYSQKGDKIEGYIVSDSQATLSAMREQEEALSGMLKTEEEQEVEIRYVHAKDVDLAKFSAKTTETFDEEQSQTQTKTLYHMAESFLKTLRSLEISQ